MSALVDETPLIRRFKQGDLVVMTVLPRVAGVISTVYDGLFEPEAELFTKAGHGNVITGLACLRHIKPSKDEHYDLLDRFHERMESVELSPEDELD